MTDVWFDIANRAPLPMNNSSVNYGRILRNLLRLLDATCGASFYEVFPRGVQLWLPAKMLGMYPDIMVVAGAPLLSHGRGDRVINPCLVFEILPQPTTAYNPMEATMRERSTMFTHCRSIPYLQEYVFVHQQEARIEQFYRAQENLWGLTAQTGFDSVIELNITNARLPLMEVYDKIDFALQV